MTNNTNNTNITNMLNKLFYEYARMDQSNPHLPRRKWISRKHNLRLCIDSSLEAYHIAALFEILVALVQKNTCFFERPFDSVIRVLTEYNHIVPIENRVELRTQLYVLYDVETWFLSLEAVYLAVPQHELGLRSIDSVLDILPLSTFILLDLRAVHVPAEPAEPAEPKGDAA